MINQSANHVLIKEVAAFKFKKSAVLRTRQKAVTTSQTRQEIYDPENRTENLSLRAGVEGTGSALKRAEGAGKLRVRFNKMQSCTRL